MTHNTDVGDSWEREGDDPNYFSDDVGTGLRLRHKYTVVTR